MGWQVFLLPEAFICVSSFQCQIRQGNTRSKKVTLLEELWLLSGYGDKALDFTEQEICLFFFSKYSSSLQTMHS